MTRLSRVLAGLALAGGCGGGGGGGDAATYRRAGDAVCTRAYEATARLPELQREKGLEIDQVQARSREIDRRFDRELAALDPPADLADRHAALARQIKRPLPGGRATFTFLDDIRRRYTDLGLRGCADRVAASERLLRRVAGRSGG